MLSDNENCSSEDEIYDSDVEQGSKKRKRKAKVADNTKVNSLSPEQIDRWIAELFLDTLVLEHAHMLLYANLNFLCLIISSSLHVLNSLKELRSN